MAKIDEIKEILSTLRVALSIAFGILVVIVGSLVKRYDALKVDAIFWIGIVFVFFVLLFIVQIVKKISKKTKELKDL